MGACWPSGIPRPAAIVANLEPLPFRVPSATPIYGLVSRDTASGRAWVAGASVAVGADGLMVEVHCDPPSALSDGPQSLYPAQFEQLMRQVTALANLVSR